MTSCDVIVCGREWGGGWRLFEAGRLLTFSAFRMGAYSRWALIRGWALIRKNTVAKVSKCLGYTKGVAVLEVPSSNPSYDLKSLLRLLSFPCSFK